MYRDVSQVLRELEGTHRIPVSAEVDDDVATSTANAMSRIACSGSKLTWRTGSIGWVMNLSAHSVVTLPTRPSGPLKSRPNTSRPKAIAHVGKPIRQAFSDAMLIDGTAPSPATVL